MWVRSSLQDKQGWETPVCDNEEVLFGDVVCDVWSWASIYLEKTRNSPLQKQLNAHEKSTSGSEPLGVSGKFYIICWDGDLTLYTDFQLGLQTDISTLNSSDGPKKEK